MMRPLTAARLIGLSSVLLTAAVGSAGAHPHVFVSNQVTVIYKDGAVTGLQHRWIFDEIYTASAVEGLDKNNDGKLDKAELDELTQINIEGLKEFDYFTTATLGGNPIKFGAPHDYFMEVVAGDEPPGPQMALEPVGKPAQEPGFWSRLSQTIGHWWGRLTGRGTTASAGSNTAEAGKSGPSQLLTLTFTTPLQEPVPATADGLQFTIYDGQMFIAFELAAKNPVSLSDAPSGCNFKIGEPELDEQQKRLQEAFGRVGGMPMSGSAKAVTLWCPKP